MLSFHRVAAVHVRISSVVKEIGMKAYRRQLDGIEWLETTTKLIR